MVVHTSDRYSFLLIEIQFERSKLGNSKKIELSSELSGVRDIRASCVWVGVCTHIYVCVIWNQSTFYTSSTVHVEYESFADDISQHENVATLIPLLSNVEILDVVCLVRIFFFLLLLPLPPLPLFTPFGNLIFMGGERKEG